MPPHVPSVLTVKPVDEGVALALVEEAVVEETAVEAAVVEAAVVEVAVEETAVEEAVVEAAVVEEAVVVQVPNADWQPVPQLLVSISTSAPQGY